MRAYWNARILQSGPFSIPCGSHSPELWDDEKEETTLSSVHKLSYLLTLAGFVQSYRVFQSDIRADSSHQVTHFPYKLSLLNFSRLLARDFSSTNGASSSLFLPRSPPRFLTPLTHPRRKGSPQRGLSHSASHNLGELFIARIPPSPPALHPLESFWTPGSLVFSPRNALYSNTETPAPFRARQSSPLFRSHRSTTLTMNAPVHSPAGQPAGRSSTASSATSSSAASGTHQPRTSASFGAVQPAPVDVKTHSTDAFLRDFSLVAEAAKRAQMAVMVRDFESIGLAGVFIRLSSSQDALVQIANPMDIGGTGPPGFIGSPWSSRHNNPLATEPSDSLFPQHFQYENPNAPPPGEALPSGSIYPTFAATLSACSEPASTPTSGLMFNRREPRHALLA
ncbi:hypothetical protein SODALDRAFT_363137 [Sodiomyces alkalinus F11]|uniref:Uncharacterized protein n=1 Tax=Sodiomyces alkalinus (strain CBS 110278 / VKM F-3762 / F11) TaxID=1314773 RepID=A0A3N2PLA7_SODAK|nr:hypothetical protein SODALDRAFT_363137 [Sodiomyces alkalinus F11]ROT35321.1 hypothetical protein SODALDRAFT_363137 [Sodiomyces alkalinus F11]